MDQISPKERLFRAFDKKSIDRRPVICPGGMMNAAVVDVMTSTGHLLPAAHSDDQLMSELSYDVSRLTGFENFGLPFCMTVEAEVMGSEIDFGTLECEPKIRKERYASAADVQKRDIQDMLRSGRIGTIARAAWNLSRRDPEVPVIGSLTGPISTAASLVDPMTFLKEMRKRPQEVHRVMEYVTDFLIAYTGLLLDNGADLISIADPTSTGEILGPKMFHEYSVLYLNRLIDSIHARGKKAILHICGDLSRVLQFIPELHADVISTDAMVNLQKLKERFPEIVTMGNLSTFLLELSEPERISKATEILLAGGIDIIAPACGLSTSSALRNLQSFTGTVRESRIS